MSKEQEERKMRNKTLTPVSLQRRKLLSAAGAGLLLLQWGAAPFSMAQAANASAGRLKQSVARWCFAEYDIETLCQRLQAMGVSGMDLASPDEWETCQRYGITPLMVQGGGGFRPAPANSARQFGPSYGWNRIENHRELLSSVELSAKQASAAGVHSMIGLFGDRGGMSDAEGIRNSIRGLRKVLPILEQYDMTLSLELLNSVVDHPDYQGNNTAFGVAVCDAVDSERVKLVYDVYHMQLMEGNLISTIRENIKYISHFHVAGVPGRNEIDETQEVNWRAVANAIADLNFQGFVAHEWVPTAEDPLEALEKAVRILTV